MCARTLFTYQLNIFADFVAFFFFFFNLFDSFSFTLSSDTTENNSTVFSTSWQPKVLPVGSTCIETTRPRLFLNILPNFIHLNGYLALSFMVTSSSTSGSTGLPSIVILPASTKVSFHTRNSLSLQPVIKY